MAHHWPKEISLQDWVVVSYDTLINWVMLTELQNLYINILQKEKPKERENIKFHISSSQEGGDPAHHLLAH